MERKKERFKTYSKSWKKNKDRRHISKSGKKNGELLWFNSEHYYDSWELDFHFMQDIKDYIYIYIYPRQERSNRRYTRTVNIKRWSFISAKYAFFFLGKCIFWSKSTRRNILHRLIKTNDKKISLFLRRIKNIPHLISFYKHPLEPIKRKKKERKKQEKTLICFSLIFSSSSRPLRLGLEEAESKQRIEPLRHYLWVGSLYWFGLL